MQAMPSARRPVPLGPRAYRTKLRLYGPLMAMALPAALGLLSVLLLHDSDSTSRGVVGFGLAIFAAPGLLAAGVPLTTGAGAYLLAIVGSAVLWFLLGALAAFRATRSPVASWRDFWRELLWLQAGVWVGVVGALMVANLALGNALF